ncbi:3-methyl-2-oxobutanoate hydroxymethyltransferase [Pelagicoccus sp. SDUM812003]|uniref:3-methyl-2-oxobutanoate hydroxymethyltransferase n=1 Tax=Pelagicoccus sp. SDUM812003 TaxID=3041267 RepID=UPI00280E95F1|nr:3-methyl-2-oxobutanoate hydroxymethyltransferase [Pelagicoccus sp. SDUM812003]MDQ8205540.1 3-methyl-2-oxobutanoate hydroxymethyltransferase [Pelagicoccus sp. SDUM812003]
MKSIPDFLKWKADGRAITMVTCYDAATAKILNASSVDSILVGDSCAMVVHGYDSTVHATVEMIATHTAAVRRGAPDKVIIADLPFLSNRKGTEIAMDAVDQLMKAGANAVKLERRKGNIQLIEHIVDSGVPVMGHLGLTPQSVNAFGGFKMQAKSDAAARALIEDAKMLELAGCFSVVLECIPGDVAAQVTEALTIPTIGIGCGPEVSGQVLVVNDLLGMDRSFQPRFARKYANLAETIGQAVDSYCADVQSKAFPAAGEYSSKLVKAAS